MKKETVKYPIHVPRSMNEELEKRATEEGMTKSGLVRQLVYKAIKEDAA